MADCITYVGLDVHKEEVFVALAEGGLRGAVRDYGRIANTPAALTRLVGKLGRDGVTLRFSMRQGLVVTAFSASFRRLGMTASWWRRR